VKIEGQQRCAVCTLSVFDIKATDSLTAFFCHHIYHQSCLSGVYQAKEANSSKQQQQPLQQQNCVVCHNMKAKQNSKTPTKKLGGRGS
jgi:hypothetical protein